MATGYWGVDRRGIYREDVNAMGSGGAEAGGADGRLRSGCPFCERIARGEVTFAEGAAVGFPDAVPVTRGHTLVVSRRHEPDLLALSAKELDDMWRLARHVCAVLAEDLQADGFNLGVNVGRAAGQTVPHAHLHVMPRFAEDTDDPRGGVRWIFPSSARYWRT